MPLVTRPFMSRETFISLSVAAYLSSKRLRSRVSFASFRSARWICNGDLPNPRSCNISRRSFSPPRMPSINSRLRSSLVPGKAYSLLMAARPSWLLCARLERLIFL